MEKNKITIRLCYIELIIFAGILVTMIFHFRCGFEKSFFALMIIAALAGCGVSLALKDYLKSMIQSSAFDVAGVHNKKALEKQLQQIQDEDDTLDTGIMMFDLNNLKIMIPMDMKREMYLSRHLHLFSPGYLQKTVTLRDSAETNF